MNIDKMLDQFQTIEEIKIYCNAQAKQVQQLSKENKELKEKLLTANKESKEVIKRELSTPGFQILDDAKTISQIQLNLLKDISFDRELTTDEAKRVEIYNRILIVEVEKEKKPLKADVEILSGHDLLKLVE